MQRIFHPLLIGLLVVANLAQAQIGNETQGAGSGASLSTGDRCTFYGDSSGYQTNTGFDNTFVGHRAGYSMTSGDYSVAIGSDAMPATTTANNNIAIGYRTLHENTTGNDNVVIGYEAGRVSTNGSDNVIIGREAGENIQSGDDNVIIGYWAGRNTGASRSCFVGHQAGYSNTTGTENTFIGNTAGRANTTGTNNVAVGNEAGYDCSTGQRNVFIGDSTGIDNGAGSFNTFVGQGAGARNEHADYNTFIGYFAGVRTNVSNGTSNANRNTFLGAFSGDRNEEGQDNIAIGHHADQSTDGHNQSMVIGNYAVVGNSTTDRTGPMAFGYSTRAGQNYDLAIGYDADVNASNSIGLGYQANVTGTHSIGIGYQATLTSQADYSMAIGDNARANYGYSAAFGTNALADTNNSFVVGGITSVDRMTMGIGTTKPNQKASIDLSETDHGFLINRMTTAQETAFGTSLSATEEGMLIYNADDNTIKAWDGTQWVAPGVQNLTLTGNTLNIDNGVGVDLSAYLDDTQLTEAQVDAYVANNGYLTSFTEVDGDVTNEIQDISLVGNNLSISSGSTIDLSAYLDDTQLTEAEVDAYVANNGYLTSFTEVDGDVTNEIQDISLVGNNLSISSGSTIDLSAYLDDTQLTETEVDAYVANNGYLTSFTEVDGDVTNEIQDISLVGNNLSISSGSTVDLSGLANTDAQNLTAATLSGTVLEIEIENGTSVSVDLEPLLASLQAQVDSHNDRITDLEECACDGMLKVETNEGVNGAVLYQNIPNPFNNTSSIKYFIPQQANSANLVISSNAGQVVSNIELEEKGGYGEVQINAVGLSTGVYFYTLYVNQVKVDTKKMIIE